MAACALLALGLTWGAFSADGPSMKGNPRNAFEWAVVRHPSERVIRVGHGVGYCVGDPRPRIKEPEIAYRGGDVYIRLELAKRGPLPSSGGLCAGLELLVKKTIRLKRDLSGLNLYDSGVDPPERRWPE